MLQAYLHSCQASPLPLERITDGQFSHHNAWLDRHWWMPVDRNTAWLAQALGLARLWPGLAGP
eukprot:565867-Amphidinium_carterae.1